MEDVLCEVFSTLKKSEDEVSAEKKKCQKVRDEIRELSADSVRDTKAIKLKKIEKVNLMKGLVDLQARNALLDSSLATSSELKQGLESDISVKNKIIKGLDYKKEKMVADFSSSTIDFIQTYGIGNGCKKKKLTLAKESLQGLLLKHKKLLSDIKSSEQDLLQIKELTKRYHYLDEGKEVASEKLRKLDQSIEEEEESLASAKQDVEILESFDTNDQEYLSAQAELQNLEDGDLTAKARDLQEQVHHLNKLVQQMKYQQFKREQLYESKM